MAGKKNNSTKKESIANVSPREKKSLSTNGTMDDVQGLTLLGSKTTYNVATLSSELLEAFPNRYPNRDYLIRFEHPEFSSLCPQTGQPDFGTIILEYVPGACCVESKSFKLYMVSFRNEGAFMETIVNRIADDLVALLKPRRMVVHGLFNVRGGTSISVRVDYYDTELSKEEKANLRQLW